MWPEYKMDSAFRDGFTKPMIIIFLSQIFHNYFMLVDLILASISSSLEYRTSVM